MRNACFANGCGGFSIGGVHVARDLGFTLASRALTAPVPKAVRKSVPFTNGSYDFSGVYGRVFYEDRELTYTFTVLGESPQETEAGVARLLSFSMSALNAEIHDDDSPYYHFTGSYSESEVEWDEDGCSASVEVTFLVSPFRISDDPCEARVEVGDNTVVNHGQPTRMTVVPDSTMTIQIGALKQTFSGETVADIALSTGENTVKVTSGGGIIRWSEEVV